MPANTANQQITLPIGTDAADAPQAFTDQTADLENRLVQRYVSDADRAARNPAPNLGELSIVTANTWYDRYTGAKWLPVTPLQVRKTVTQTVNNSTVLVNDNELLIALPLINTSYGIEMYITYTSSTVADIKFTFSVPAGATGSFCTTGLAVGAAGTTGDGQFDATGLTTTISIGGAGQAVGCLITGTINTAAATGNLQFRWAQDTAEVSNTTVNADSWLRVTAIS